MCNSKDSALALIPNSQVYNIITTMIRSKIPAHVENVRIWTKLQIDPLTGDTIPANAYTMWLPNRPATSEDNVDKTHVYLVINRDPTSTGQGMANMSPQKEIHGVACQLQVNEAIEARSLTTQKITSSFEGLQLTNTIVMAGNQHTMHTSIEKVVISTEKPILDESTTGKSVDFRGGPTCEYQFESICYWTDVHDFKMINYSQAQEKCLERNSTLASIANDEVYNNIINLLRSKVTSGQNMFFWIELQIEPLTNVTTPANAYTRWFPNLSYLGGRRIDSTHVYLALNRDPVFSNQGMVNNKPETLNNGMVCQFQKN
uniref:uncharacterized protein LOC120341156 n=1 Tax=Styela clava TaxID=7725 RepID=UPI0019394AEC|nr:uncharacterized protein LOC120341156 [Styela clava]